MTAASIPTFWFAAPDPVVGLGTTVLASEQFNSLLTPATAAPWPTLAGQPSVISLGLTFVEQASMAELQEVIDYINRNHLQLSLSTAAVPYQPNGVGTGVEGYVSLSQLSAALSKIQSLGGTVNLVAMDGALFFGHEATGNTEQASINTLAQQVASTVAVIKAVFPNAQIGENDGPASAGDIAQWAAAFKQATGSPLAFLQADADGNDPNIEAKLQTFALAAHAAGVPFGLLVDGTGDDKSDVTWSTDALRLMAASAANPLIAPSHYVTVSWNSYPDQLLPAGLSGTLAHVALEASAVVPYYQSGLLSGNPGGTVAFVGPSATAIPVTLNAILGGVVAVPGFALSGPGTAASAKFAVVVTDVSGTLTAQAAGGGTVVGNGTGALTITGTLAGIDAELATLCYTAAVIGGDTIDATAFDGQGYVGELQVGTTAAALTGSYGAGSYPSAAQAQSTITTLLQQLGVITPSTATIASWTAALLEGTSLASIRASLTGSAGVITELNTVAKGATGVNPSVATLTAMQNLLNQGETMAQIAASMLAGSPAQVQMQSLYQQMLGTMPVSAFLGQMTLATVTGASLTSIRASIAQLAAPTATLSAMYNFVYGVAPTASQIAALQSEMTAGSSLQQVEATLDAVARAEITTMYQQTLDRLPNSTELNVAAARMEAGTSMAGLREVNYDSSEEVNDISAFYHAVTGTAPPSSTITLMKGMIAKNYTLDQVKSDVASITTLYQQVTGSVASASSIESWLGVMATGQSLAGVRAIMVQNGLAKAPIIAAYTADFGHAPSSAVQQALQNDILTQSMSTLLASLAQQAKADLPTIGGMSTSEAVTSNSQLLPFYTTAVNDPTAGDGQQVTAVIQISAPIATLAGGGFTVSNNGLTLTSLTASAAWVQTWIRGLTLYPKAQTVNASTQVKLTITNDAGHSATSSLSLTIDAKSSATHMNFINLSAGNSTIAATPMADLFVISSPNFGLNTISAFDVARDIVSLPSTTFANFAAVQHDLSSTLAGAVLRLDAQDSLTLAGVAATSLTAKNFEFG